MLISRERRCVSASVQLAKLPGANESPGQKDRQTQNLIKSAGQERTRVFSLLGYPTKELLVKVQRRHDLVTSLVCFVSRSRGRTGETAKGEMR